jgi:hypothetical protein
MSTKHKIISSGIGLLVIFLTFWAINAQDAVPTASMPVEKPATVALVDINYLFKRNESFNEEMGKLKKDASEMDAKMKEGKTPVPQDVQTKRGEYLQREAEIYRRTFRDISDEITKYSAEHQIDMVLRFSGDPTDANSPEGVLAEINKPVVHYNPKLDITPAILKIMAEKK